MYRLGLDSYKVVLFRPVLRHISDVSETATLQVAAVELTSDDWSVIIRVAVAWKASLITFRNCSHRGRIFRSAGRSGRYVFPQHSYFPQYVGSAGRTIYRSLYYAGATRCIWMRHLYLTVHAGVVTLEYFVFDHRLSRTN